MVLAHGEPVLARALALDEVGRVSLGTFQSFGTRTLPSLLGRPLRDEYHVVQVVEAGSGAAVLAAFAAGSVERDASARVDSIDPWSIRLDGPSRS